MRELQTLPLASVHDSLGHVIRRNAHKGLPPYAGCAYHKHLYVGENGKYLAKLNSWEKALIKAEIARDDVVGWLRNYERKPWALSLPYEYAGETKPMFPDFLVIRKNGSAWNVDILEPHASTLADSWAKAKGLAEFATKHGDHFGRIELIRMAGKSLKRLDLNDDGLRADVIPTTGLEMSF